MDKKEFQLFLGYFTDQQIQMNYRSCDHLVESYPPFSKDQIIA